jgi:hypothetical protein
MLCQFQKNAQSFLSGKPAIKLAVSFAGFFQGAEFRHFFFHAASYHGTPGKRRFFDSDQPNRGLRGWGGLVATGG